MELDISDIFYATMIVFACSMVFFILLLVDEKTDTNNKLINIQDDDDFCENQREYLFTCEESYTKSSCLDDLNYERIKIGCK